jgi:hypothetical protein
VSARLLARTGAVLARIDGVLDDPYPAAVARLLGVPGSYWFCHRPDDVTIGARCIEDDDPLCSHNPGADHEACDDDHQDERAECCWGGVYCTTPASTDIGLCGWHHAEIVTGLPRDPDAFAARLDAWNVDLQRVLAMFDLPDHIVAPIPAPTEENPTR